MPESEFIDQLIERIKDFKLMNEGKSPEKIYVTSDEEAEIAKLGFAEIGSLSDKVLEEGPRSIGPEIMGLEIVWDSPESRLE